jgi:hypothetical protein
MYYLYILMIDDVTAEACWTCLMYNIFIAYFTVLSYQSVA